MKNYLKLSFLIFLIYTLNVRGQNISQKIDSTYIELKIGSLDSINCFRCTNEYTTFGRAIPKGTIILNLDNNKLYLSGLNKPNWNINNGVVLEIPKFNGKYYIHKRMFIQLDYMYKSRYLYSL